MKKTNPNLDNFWFSVRACTHTVHETGFRGRGVYRVAVVLKKM